MVIKLGDYNAIYDKNVHIWGDVPIKLQTWQNFSKRGINPNAATSKKHWRYIRQFSIVDCVTNYDWYVKIDCWIRDKHGLSMWCGPTHYLQEHCQSKRWLNYDWDLTIHCWCATNYGWNVTTQGWCATSYGWNVANEWHLRRHTLGLIFSCIPSTAVMGDGGGWVGCRWLLVAGRTQRYLSTRPLTTEVEWRWSRWWRDDRWVVRFRRPCTHHDVGQLLALVILWRSMSLYFSGGSLS